MLPWLAVLLFVLFLKSLFATCALFVYMYEWMSLALSFYNGELLISLTVDNKACAGRWRWVFVLLFVHFTFHFRNSHSVFNYCMCLFYAWLPFVLFNC